MNVLYENQLQNHYVFKGCDLFYELTCLNFKSRYKWNNYLALNNTCCTRIALENYIQVHIV